MDLWAQVLARAGRRLNRQSFDTWIFPLQFVGLEGATLHLRAPNESFRMSLIENYGDLLSGEASEAAGKPLRLLVSVAPEAPVQQKAAPPTQAEPESSGVPLNPRYTFPSFVVGASNQFAWAAAQAVAERPSRSYNPLYIYGGVGLGKTHLMHAIGHFIRERSSHVQITYMSSERFMNELVNAIRYDRTIQFRQRYRNIDVLLMDDIQFIARWERTQEEFFHTFNALYDAQKQIVITSDCPPKEIPHLEERLHSRFEWGLIADIQPPDIETKLAILRKKAETHLPELSDEVAVFIARSVRSSVRELEGALTRLSARASLEGIDPAAIDVAYAREVLRGIITEDLRSVTADRIIEVVSTYYGLKPAQLKSKNNSRPISQPRQIAMYLCKELTRLSLPQIGRDFGGKHHTTVLHSIRKIEEVKEKDSSISEAVSKIRRTLAS